jgi:thioesterase domain-containing protein/acyl carrier protein
MMTEARLRPWLVALAQELSGLDELPEAVPFEELGFDSFAVLSLATEIGVRLGVTLSPEELVIHRTIADLARLLADRAPGDERSVVTVREGAGGPVLVLVHTATGDANFFAQALRHVPADQAIMALHWRPPESAPPLESLEAHAACFLPLMRIAIPHGGTPRAPWCLLGYSAGARLAFVLAQQAWAAGEGVAFLGLLDDGVRPGERGAGLAGTPVPAGVAGIPALHRRHVPEAYPGDIWLRTASSAKPGSLADPLLSWGEFCLGRLDHAQVPKDHHAMLGAAPTAAWIPPLIAAMRQAFAEAVAEGADFVPRRMPALAAWRARPGMAAATRGRRAGRAGDLRAEIDAYVAAIGAGDMPWWVWRNLGDALLEAGDAPAAIVALRAAAAREARPIVALTHLLRAQRMAGDAEGMEATLAAARALEAPDHAMQLALAHLDRVRGEPAAGVARLEELLRREGSQEVVMRLSALQARVGDRAGGLGRLREAAAKAPYNPTLRMELERLEAEAG